MAIVDFFRPDILTHAAYYPAALFATLVGGAWAGLLALALGAMLAWWIFEPPYLGPLAAQHTDLALYLISSLLIVWQPRNIDASCERSMKKSIIASWSAKEQSREHLRHHRIRTQSASRDL